MNFTLTTRRIKTVTSKLMKRPIFILLLRYTIGLASRLRSSISIFLILRELNVTRKMHLTTTKVATSTIPSKTSGETMTITLLNCANLLRLRNVLKRKSVEEHTIGLRDYITKTSIRLNSVISFLLRSNNVSTGITAPLPIQWKISR